MQADYLPALDGLRAVSILLVVLSHLGLDRVVPGAFGVTLFFFISGYLITRQLAGALALQGRIGFARFYARRALRLAPAATVYILLAGSVFCAAGGRISAAAWGAALLYGANYFDLWVGYRSSLGGVRHPFNILWSLAIEEHFYAVWPVVLSVLWRRRAALAAVLTLCGGALVWRWWLLGHCFTAEAPALCGSENPNPAWRYNRLYLATDARLDSLAWGAALALLEQAGRMPPRWLAWPGVLLLAVSFVGTGPLARDVVRPTLQGAALLGVVPVIIGRKSYFLKKRTKKLFLVGVHGPFRIGPHVQNGKSFLVLFFKKEHVLFLGRLSYSLYLWHWGALMIADLVAPRFGAIWVAVGALLAVVLALLSYRLVEQPMLGVRRRFGSHAPG